VTLGRPLLIRCDCCGVEVVAALDGNRLVIRQRRHGRPHHGVIVLDAQTLDRLLSRVAESGSARTEDVG